MNYFYCIIITEIFSTTHVAILRVVGKRVQVQIVYFLNVEWL